MKNQIKILKDVIKNLNDYFTDETSKGYGAERHIKYLYDKYKTELERMEASNTKFETTLDKIFNKQTKKEYIPRIKKCFTCNGCYLLSDKIRNQNNGNSTMIYDGHCDIGFKVDEDKYIPLEPCLKPLTQYEYQKSMLLRKNR